MQLLRCNVCGREQEGRADEWYALYFGLSAPFMLVEPEEASVRLGQKHACSRQCLAKLVLEWTEAWRAKREQRACA